MKIVVIEERALANGNKKVNSFSGAPKDGVFNGIPDGTIILMPTVDELKVFQNVKFQNAEYCIVKDAANPDEGYEFYPSSCGKRYFLVDEDGMREEDDQHHQKCEMPRGEFAEKYRGNTSVQNWFVQVAGRRVKVEYKDEVRILPYGQTTPKLVKVATYTFVD